ncbi:MAG: carboxymuconolactone decarboxylase family protein [Pseudomonadota bacterium]
MKTTVHTLETAPAESQPLLENSIKAFGRLPSLHAVMAESPGLLEGYQRLHKAAIEATAFTPEERTVVWMATNVFHACHYCVPAHTGIAKREKIDDAVIDALRDETPLPDAKLEALRAFTLAVLETRGRPSAEAVAAFEAAGYGERAALDTVMIIAQKVMSNFTNSLFDTPTDAAFEKFLWTPKAPADAA